MGRSRAHGATRSPRTVTILRERLAYALALWENRPLGQLTPGEIADWQPTLPERSRYGIVQALRQTLEAAVRWGLIAANPAKLAGPNPQPRREEIEPFTIEETDRLAVELGRYGSLVVFAAETGLRPAEWIAVEWKDIDRGDGALVVERSYAYGRLTPYGKTAASRRRVPLSGRALAALDAQTRRIDTRLVFPADRGGYLNLHNWRARDWHPALEAAGLRRRRPYDLRHTYATHALGRRTHAVRSRPLHGHVGGDDQPHLRPPRTRQRRAGPAAARHLRRGTFGPRQGHKRGQSPAVTSLRFAPIPGSFRNGRTWDRTRDLPRVKRALSR